MARAAAAVRPLQPLQANQADGAAPDGSAWLSASAGTGKTQVLTARILRLLLDGAAPERILALTFTKAGAAEMQTRVFDRLAAWVAADDAALRSDLAAIRADTSPDTLARARQLFARTLDARGGLNVQTIHGFAQSLLASFPVEAGIAPGFAALDDRSALALRGEVLAEAIEASGSASGGDPEFIDDVGAISVAGGEARLATIAATLIRHGEAIAALGDPAGFEPKLRRAFGLPTDGTPATIMADAVATIDLAAVRRLAEVCERHGGGKARDRADILRWWLACTPAVRAEQFDALCKAFHAATGERFKSLVPGGGKADSADIALADALCAAVTAVAETRRLLAAVANAARHLRVGARLAAAYALRKHRAGVIDYDDMIARAATLLTGDGAAAWVRYKLDRRIDHLLVDEAQDTNEAQWDIVEALTDEFFAGEGARDLRRTLFVVGDFKQAIFSFQGSDPRIFEGRQGHFRDLAEDAGLGWRDLPLTESFRSTPAVLEVVDAVADALGHAAFGTSAPIPEHVPFRRDAVGSVTLWPPLVAEADEEAPDGDAPWLPAGQVLMAHRLARQIAAWLDPATALALPARGRRVRPEDILVLVRSRGEFVGALVAALHDFGVPVAGVDRLRLTEPLAVQDLLALVRFGLQPNDDLTCAALLTSPFVGLDQDALFALAHARRGSLWSAVRDAGGPAADFLGEVLRLADFSAPYEFLEAVLTRLGGRRRLLARLGEEARDAIGAMLGQALAFETANAPSLQGFLAWVEADDIDLKRDPEAPVDAVRIMTVHGAKGLQAPVVVLVDATREPARDRHGHVMLELDGGLPVPVFHGGKAGRIGVIAARAAAAEADAAAEHWRLLYVALTRAEDLLFVGGPLAKQRGASPAKLPAESWYAAVEAAMAAAFPLAAEADPLWGEVRVHRAGSTATPEPAAPPRVPLPRDLPAWALAPAAPEARPPRPLSPSAIAADDVAQPPPGPALAAAARRGQLLHALFERLPAVAAARRQDVAAAWLARAAPDLAARDRAHLAATALGIIAAPAFADLFGPDALAEAPIAATVGDVVIAGKVDRLLVEPHRVRLIDFKTGAAVPADAAAVAPYHLRQMAAYVAALERIFPGRAVSAALLYTHDATLIELPARLIAELGATISGSNSQG